ncbi:hypothetical protein NE237_005270 [Protea cynaroides]|uniref:Uncharacterized protein n=1 Tax=Protea cynaroides TaxID=273540 RepID=A0A9Q0KL21_9MAGN|nr:hypothetical protein NE237_005270 [Protea cynaroides]
MTPFQGEWQTGEEPESGRRGNQGDGGALMEGQRTATGEAGNDEGPGREKGGERKRESCRPERDVEKGGDSQDPQFLEIDWYFFVVGIFPDFVVRPSYLGETALIFIPCWFIYDVKWSMQSNCSLCYWKGCSLIFILD